jgi:hypothetical protein
VRQYPFLLAPRVVITDGWRNLNRPVSRWEHPQDSGSFPLSKCSR